MPTYDRQCSREECQCVAENLFERMSDPSAIKCPECGHRTFTRVISGGAAVTFKGFIEPYYEWQLPLRAGEKPGEPNVRSYADLKDRAKEHGLEINQGMSTDAGQ